MKRGSKGRSAAGPRSDDAGSGGAYWSGEVTRNSSALDLDAGVFALDEPEKIAASLKKSAEASTRRKSPPFRSAMSMLNFYLNRAGRNLPQERKEILERAKTELRKQFERPPKG
jgi:hypothetical protein